jgi:DNA-binding NarL/FixJ family response regulator
VSDDAAVVRVLLVDDQELIRSGLRRILRRRSGFEVVAECADGSEVLAALAGHSVDVILMDLRMKDVDGVEATRLVRSDTANPPVLVLTTFDDDELVLAALRAGARGYLLKDVTLHELVGAVETLAAGGTLMRPAITDRLLRALREGEAPATEGPEQRLAPLTDRERDVLRLLAAGLSNREIAQALSLAEGTVKNHVSSVLMKLGTRDRTRAVLRALHHGLLN